MNLPDVAFLHRLADLADAETMPRYRTDIAVDTKVKKGYTFDPVTEADRAAEAAIRAEIGARFPIMPSSAKNSGGRAAGAFNGCSIRSTARARSSAACPSGGR